ncbi:oxidoreductase [Burkholderia sp. Bp9143]|uniref:PDR/VanB family oxidoreductase n=1 Tax=Burkholderia sp. Bp9143 TaxID=2184574 RepID=UPI000F5A58D1|nr:PDR/VanB family oxidoreductase [Burkholderia sp. Bp9143]RQR27759.1 oxidoreductase [Burkholderia sp. Bp9143]
MKKDESMMLVVTGYRAEALDVASFELRDPNGKDLPQFSPGAHLEITLPQYEGTPGTLIRHYSLCNDPSERHRYVVAVGRAANSRGGSLAMHEHVRVGSNLRASSPRNNFPLVGDARHYRFIAGGIGITPILSMIRWCQSYQKSWSLLYCTRGRTRTAFYETLKEFGDSVRFHFDDESGGSLSDLVRELADGGAGEHVYCCGPSGLMHAVEQACADRCPESVHFEWFATTDRSTSERASDEAAFDIVLQSTGQRLHVEPGTSILETLERQGMSVPFACREGLCRTCETPLCGGEADHRDYVLSEEERRTQSSVMICVSRARSSTLTLGL